MLGHVDLPEGGSTCGMPVSMQIENLRRDIASRMSGYTVELTDLYSLQGADRDVALDAVVAGEPSPFVLVDGELVSTGAIRAEQIVDALLGSPLPAEVLGT